jgi:hypothetical protein
MASKKQHYNLDDIGFIGTQEKRSKAQLKRDIEDTVNYIKAKKAVKTSKPQMNKQKLLNAK